MPTEKLEQNSELKEASEYRRISDERTLGYFKLGILDDNLAEEAINDPTSINVKIEGVELPGIVDIRYSDGAGYDPSKCVNMISEINPESKPVFFYAAPPITDTEASDVNLGNLPDEGFIFYSHDENDDHTPSNIQKILENNNYEVSGVPLLDDDAAPDNQQAAGAVYSFRFEGHKAGEPIATPSLDDFIDNYKNGVAEGKYNTENEGAKIFKGSELSPELLDDLWILYKEKFEFLSEKHPIKTEATKEDFLHLITSDHTFTSIYFADGKPQCLVIATDDEDQLYWANKEYMTKDKIGLRDDELFMSYPGVVSKSIGTVKYLEKALQEIRKVVMDLGVNYRVLFEATNRSELYIPTLLKQYLEGEEGKVELARRIDKHYFRCLKFTKRG